MKLQRFLKYVKKEAGEDVMLNVDMMLEDKHVRDMFIFDAVREMDMILKSYLPKKSIAAVMCRFLKHERRKHRITMETEKNIIEAYEYYFEEQQVTV